MSLPIDVGVMTTLQQRKNDIYIFHDRLAWSSFKSDKSSIQEWIRKKVKELTPEQRNEIKAVETVAGWISGGSRSESSKSA